MTPAYPPSELALADVNGDRRLDLGVSDHGSYAIDILLNDGVGRFTPAPGSRFAASDGGTPHTHGFALVDVNRDGRTDIVMGPLMGQLDEEAIEQIAAFYASQPGLFQTPR